MTNGGRKREPATAASFLRSLSARDQRALLLLAAATAMFLLLDLLVLPVMDPAEKLRASLPLKEKTLRKHRRLVALAADQKKEFQEMQARLAEAEKGLLSSSTSALAAAELQEVIKQLMAKQGMEMRNAAFRPVRVLKVSGASYNVVPLSLSFQCRLDQLTSFLLAAHASRKVLALDQLSIRALPSRPGRPQKPQKPQKMVAVRMVIRGLMFAEPAPTPKA